MLDERLIATIFTSAPAEFRPLPDETPYEHKAAIRILKERGMVEIRYVAAKTPAKSGQCSEWRRMART